MRSEWKVPFAAGAWMLAGAVGWAQAPVAPAPAQGQQRTCSYTVTDESGNKITGKTNCAPQAPADTPAAQRFPFPGEQDTPAARDQPQAPAPGSGDSGKSAAQKFPFPGDDAAQGDKTGGLKDAGSSGSSSSSSSNGDWSSSSSDGGLSPNDVNSDTPPAPKRNLYRKPGPPPKTMDERFQEDLRVAKFYQNDGDYRGAYWRAQDAVKLANDAPEAHLALAEAARKLGKLDEAEKNYRETLKLDPVPKTRKAAEKALKEMTGGE